MSEVLDFRIDVPLGLELDLEIQGIRLDHVARCETRALPADVAVQAIAQTTAATARALGSPWPAFVCDPPFEDLVIYHCEVLTLEKARRLVAAWHYFSGRRR